MSEAIMPDHSMNEVDRLKKKKTGVDTGQQLVDVQYCK